MSLPIVGAHFRPPAKALLSVLPGGTVLRAVPEPENPYDGNAIAIWLDTSAIPHTHADAIATAVAGYGFSREEIFGASSWHLGYIPAKIAVALAPAMAGQEATGRLTFNLAGKPEIDLPIGRDYE